MRGVVAAVAVDEVVAGPAGQRVVAVAAADRVVAGAAVDGQVGQPGDAVLAVDRVGAGEAADDELLDCAVVDHAEPGRERGDGVAVARDADAVVGVGAAVGRGVGSLAAVDGDGALPAKSTPALTVSSPPSVATVTLSSVGSPPATRTCVDRRETTSVPASELTSTSSAASVPLAMTVSGDASPPPPMALRSTSAAVEVGAAEVVDGDVVRAAERPEVQVLDAGEVHGDGGDVAEEAHARAVGGDVDVLARRWSR